MYKLINNDVYGKAKRNLRNRIDVRLISNKQRKRIFKMDINAKLINNAVYGKTKRNLRNRIDVRLRSNKKEYLKWISMPN